MKKFFLIISLLAALGLSACGERGEMTGIETLPETGQVAVASFQQMKLPIQLEGVEHYATDGKWFYISRQKNGMYQILRGEISRDYEGEVFLSKEKAICLALAVDRESRCFALWKESGCVFLEKYDETGNLLWRADQDASQWSDIERHNSVTDLSIEGGIATTDGRLALYTHGMASLVILFDENGNMLQMDACELERLDGIAAGKNDRVYSYCITGEGEPILANIEEPSQCYVLPFRPLGVYSGHEEGIYLSTDEGLWVYDPESGHTEIKWRWNDEYMNVDYRRLRDIFCGDGEWYLMCPIPGTLLGYGSTEVTMVSVKDEDRREYGKKEIVTLGYVGTDQYLEMLVNLYNRQSKEYRIELIPYGDGQEDVTESLNAFESELLRGDGPDIIEVGGIYVRSLADKGTFCDLSDYYATSQRVAGESILDEVWKGMQPMGKKVLVIPSFTLYAQACEEPIAAEEWTPQKLIQLAEQQEELWYFGTPGTSLLQYCTMARFGEYERYVDYEEKTSHFDCPEFRWILENCAEAGKEAHHPEALVLNSNESPAFLYDYYIYNMAQYLWMCQNLKTMGCYWVGYPGWDGAFYQMTPTNMFAMNRKSQNKEGAWDFLEYILSEDCQDQIDWAFPVRKESFDRYLKTSYPSREDNQKMAAEFGISFTSYAPTEEDFENLRYMVTHSRIRITSSPITDIIYEEAGMYFTGDATLEETVRKIDNRVTLYLNE